MNDAFGRKVDYLRISVTDRCNERCLYCMPEGYKGWEQQADHLSAAEIIRVVRVAAGLGFRKFRLTGGEPLVRGDLAEIARGMAAIPGVDIIGLSTNGTRLAQHAETLRAAGIHTVNVSLDALEPELYRRITGGNVADVRAGIHAALAAGFERVKLNCVLMRGQNETELWPLVLFAAEHRLPLRFIELMPLAPGGPLDERHFLGVDEAMTLLARHDTLEAATSKPLGHGPARYYRLGRSGGLVGFIGAVTCADFCADCNKLRLTADGKLRPCLGRHGEIDLHQALRSGDSLPAAILAAIANKPEHHAFAEDFTMNRPMTAIGG